MKNERELERYIIAQKRVKEIKGFYRHLLISSIVVIVMIYINLKYTPENFWSIWVLIGCGIQILIHGVKVFNLFSLFRTSWEEKKIKQFMEEEKSNKNKFE